MKTLGVTTALTDLLANELPGNLYPADCFSFVLATGQTLSFTSWDHDVILNSVRYYSNLLSQIPHTSVDGVTRVSFKQQRGVQGDEITVQLNSANISSPTIYGLTLKEAAVAGLFDGCTLTVYRVLNPTYQANGTFSADASGYGSVKIFVGVTCEIEVNYTNIQITCRTYLDFLNQQVPRFVYQPACGWTLFGPGCYLNSVPFTLVNIQAASGSTLNQVFVNALTIPNTGIPDAGDAMPDGWLSQGMIQFVSGNNNGVVRTIQEYLGAGNEKAYNVAIFNDGPLAYYYLNESSGSTAIDYSGNGYNGTYVTGITLGIAGPLAGTPAGINNYAISLNGSSGYLTLPIPKPATVSNAYGGWSIEFWFQPTNAAFQGIFDTAPATTATIRNANVQPSAFADSAIEWNPDEPRVGFAGSTSAWSHAVINFYGARFIDVYINGNYFTGGSDANPPNGGDYAWNNPLTVGKTRYQPIGSGSASNFFYEGKLGQLAVYTYPLSINQVQTHYLAGTTNPSTNSDGIIYLFDDLPYAPAAGDRFNLLPGCDKALTTCGRKYNNILHFGGAPYIPQNEVAF